MAYPDFMIIDGDKWVRLIPGPPTPLRSVREAVAPIATIQDQIGAIIQAAERIDLSDLYSEAEKTYGWPKKKTQANLNHIEKKGLVFRSKLRGDVTWSGDRVSVSKPAIRERSADVKPKRVKITSFVHDYLRDGQFRPVVDVCAYVDEKRGYGRLNPTQLRVVPGLVFSEDWLMVCLK